MPIGHKKIGLKKVCELTYFTEGHKRRINMEKTLTPVMKQYWDAKSLHPDKIVLFQMGDFFEMFYTDATVAAPVLNIALTSRNKNKANSIPMCGIPLHAMPKVAGQLLQAGYKVVLCEQVENSQFKKGLVKRKITRILSPAMAYDPSALDELKSHYLCAFDDKTVSFSDHTTGEAFTYIFSSLKECHRIISLIQPVEIVFDEKQKKDLPLNLSQTHFSLHSDLDDSSSVSVSVRRLTSYMKKMGGPKALKSLRPFEKRYIQKDMLMSSMTPKHLEILQTFEGAVKGSLFSAVNRTVTSAGTRLLKKYLLSPLAHQETIEQRLDRVEYFFNHTEECHELREKLKAVGDLERGIGKICSPVAHARDVLDLGQSLATSLTLFSYDPYFESLTCEYAPIIQTLSRKIAQYISSEAPLSLKEGRLFNKGVNEELDTLIDWSENFQNKIKSLENQEKLRCGISSLKVRYNQIFGYYIEVTKTHTSKIPSHYIRKQTLTHAERYTTEELQQLEEKILSARETRIKKEYEMFQKLLLEIYSELPILHQIARAVHQMDVYSSLAFLALERGYVRPCFGESLHLVESRHPVIEQSRNFIPNTITMDSGYSLLLTGPNMAGKSTLMRQVALNVILAQMGSFVAATEAKMPLFKKLLTRIGSNDQLHSGLSTFMVEMTETADIIMQADEESLIVMDELGRGTSTYDGLSLAQAILEHLISKNKSYILFSTHYHELTHIKEPRIQHGYMAVQELEHDIDFLYTLKDGFCRRSYGIDVGKKAGLPSALITRAQQLIQKFEKDKINPPDLDSILDS